MLKRFLSAAAAFTMASVALCQLSKYKDWAKSPEAYFLTAPEKQEWSKITSDADAEKFIAEYWARRGGQRFKDAVTRRIAAADQQFKLRRQKGAESARGRTFITLGNPTKVTEAREGPEPEGQGQSTGVPGAPGGPGASGNLDTTAPGAVTVVQTWIYAKERFDPTWDIGEVEIRINVDPQRGTDEFVNSGAANKAIEKVVEHSIVKSPAAAAVAPVKPAAPPAASGPAPSAPAPVTAALPAATRAELEALLKAPSEKAATGFWGGEFQTVTGEPFYAFQIVDFGKKDVPAPGALKLGGLVSREDGQEALSFWEDAAGVDMKGREGTDKVVDHSISLPAGRYRGAFGLYPADGGAAVASATATFTIPERATGFRVSPLILAATLTPLTKLPNPTDAFVFGMEKPIRVEPQGNHIFRREDSLWYFFTVTNPSLPSEAPTSATPAPPTAPATPQAAPSAPAQEAPKPRIMTRLTVLKDGKEAFKPATLPAEAQKLGEHYYAAGSEIPLASFAPGYYTFTLNVRDLNAPRDSEAFKGLDRAQDFVVLTAEGTLPPPPTPTTAPKPRPKKS